MFAHNSLRLVTRQIKPSLFPSQIRARLLSTGANGFKTGLPRRTSLSPKLGLLIGATSVLVAHTHSKILNEVATLGNSGVGTIDIPSINTNTIKSPTVRTSRFGGKLEYKQLSYGSLAGLFFGIIIGKLSSVLVFISLSAFLLTQFLHNRGIITVPWTSVLKVGADRVDVRQLVLEDPSFKISFVLSFLIAAFNV